MATKEQLKERFKMLRIKNNRLTDTYKCHIQDDWFEKEKEESFYPSGIIVLLLNSCDDQLTKFEENLEELDVVEQLFTKKKAQNIFNSANGNLEAIDKIQQLAIGEMLLYSKNVKKNKEHFDFFGEVENE